MTTGLVASEVRFLEYRLDVIRRWPPSARKRASMEAISRRLAAIARSTLSRTGVDDLLTLSCQLLDDAFQLEVRSTALEAEATFEHGLRVSAPLWIQGSKR